MRCFAVIAMFALTIPAIAQENEAEKLYRSFDKKLTEAKSYTAKFDIDAPDGRDFHQAKGTLIVAAGNKLRIIFTSIKDDKDRPGAGIFVSDGKQLALKVSNDGKDFSATNPAPEQLTSFLTPYFAKAGFFVAFHRSMRPQPERSPDKIKLTEFKTGPKEKIGEFDVQVVEFRLEMPNDSFKPECKLWLDVKTNMPLKRTLQGMEDGKTFRFVELYSDWQIDPKLKGDEFTLPK